jgi:sec-independent protein translocase protein TatB
MFDIGWSEMLVIGVVALIVVGPKELPKMFHTLGQAVGKARGMAREFQRAMDAAACESGVQDLRKAASGQSLREAVGLDAIERDLRDIGQDRPAVRPATATPAPRRPEPDESEGDEADIAALDADLARRNAEFSHTEALRLQRAEQAERIRQQAADLRARSEAAAAVRTPPPAAPPPAAPHAAPDAPTPKPES